MENFKIGQLFLVDKLFGIVKENLGQNDLKDPPEDEILLISDQLVESLIAEQSVFPKNLQYLLIYLCVVCFKHIQCPQSVISEYSFRILLKIIAIKNRISRPNFKRLPLTNHVTNSALQIVRSAGSAEAVLPMREKLYEVLGFCFLSDHLDDYIENSHKLVDEIFRGEEDKKQVAVQPNPDD